MKKNLTLRLGAMACMLTMATSVFLSGTYAKYTTNVFAQDTLTIAKWDFKANGDAAAAFASATTDINIFSGSMVAPGSTGTATFTIDNTGSEVDAEYTISFTEPKTALPVMYYLASTPNVNAATLSTTPTFADCDELSEAKSAADLTSFFLDENGSTASGSKFIVEKGKKIDFVLNYVWDFDAEGLGTNDAADTAFGEASLGAADTSNPSLYTLKITVDGQQKA